MSRPHFEQTGDETEEILPLAEGGGQCHKEIWANREIHFVQHVNHSVCHLARSVGEGLSAGR